ncbi:MAG: helix-turn-helix domain-containing protein [Alphaproteobacteria bacterium]|nr:helix-turn-helix domain-containing protein [Alphaproteobacteria bacterium]MCL2504944.1 helix-turn-helix domain-containing protein [Alphaproteobacteria bacterium]
MINHEQVRAARAILNISREVLAKSTGLTVNGIAKIENGDVGANKTTLDNIQAVFENMGLEFLGNSGVRRNDKIVETYEGQEANLKLIDDVYETLKDTGGEVLIAGLDESKALELLTPEILDSHLERLKKANITERLLVSKNNTEFPSPMECYHVVADEYFSPHQIFVYGGKLALLTRIPVPKSIIINDARFAEGVKKLFNYVWERTERPSVKRVR